MKNKTEENRDRNTITVLNGKKVVLINDIRFQSRRNIQWNEIEEYLKEYIGKCYKILETSEEIYIAVDFPDEYRVLQSVRKGTPPSSFTTSATAFA